MFDKNFFEKRDIMVFVEKLDIVFNVEKFHVLLLPAYNTQMQGVLAFFLKNQITELLRPEFRFGIAHDNDNV